MTANKIIILTNRKKERKGRPAFAKPSKSFSFFTRLQRIADTKATFLTCVIYADFYSVLGHIKSIQRVGLLPSKYKYRPLDD